MNSFSALLWAILIGLSFPTLSQAAEEPAGESTTKASLMGVGVEVIPYLGGSSFTLTGGDADNSYRSGLQLGVLGAYPVSGQIALEAGLSYLETGAEQDYFIAKIETVYQALAIPVLARWTFLQTEKNRFFARGGLISSYILSAKVKGSSIFTEDTEADIMSDTNRLQLMGHLALGTFYSLNPTTAIMGDINYNEGFTKVSKSENTRARGLGLNIGVAVQL